MGDVVPFIRSQVAPKPKRATRKQGPLEVSFFKRLPRGAGINYWAVDDDDRGDGWAKGEALGEEFMAFLGKNPTYGNMTLLGCIVRDMLRAPGNKDRIGATELGFLGAVSRYATCAAYMEVRKA